jgi:hypothetical protein
LTFYIARGALILELSRLGKVSPCAEEPSLWDGADEEDEDYNEAEQTARTNQAMAWCTYCPVLALCEDVLLAALTEPELEISGVLAGEYI